MKAEDIVKIHLPNGESYKVVMENGRSTMTEDEISELRSFMSSANSIQIVVKPNKDNDLIKEKVLMLWGEVLKNTFITIDRYSGD